MLKNEISLSLSKKRRVLPKECIFSSCGTGHRSYDMPEKAFSYRFVVNVPY
jgi:hypothetical protein